MCWAAARDCRGWRRLAFATWRAPLPDPALRGHLVIDATPALAFIDRVRAVSGAHVTLTHLVVKAVARALAANPEVNVRRRLGLLVPRDTVDVGLIIAFDEGRQQAALTLAGPAGKPVAEIARETAQGAARLREARSAELARAGRVMDWLPLPVLRAGMRFFSWLSADLGVDLTRFGFPEYGMRAGGFGSALVTAVGMLGLEHGSPLLSPLSRVPVAVLVGRVGERALVVDGELRVRPAFDLSFTADHRFVDGWHAGRLAAVIEEYFADPGACD